MLTVGTYLADRYEIVSKIGAGGMSDVYKAKDHVLGRFVAIKVLRTEFSEDRTRFFQKERLCIRKINMERERITLRTVNA